MMVFDVQLLGGISIKVDGRAIEGVLPERLILFLAYLFLNFDTRISRKQLAFLFWPDSTEQQALTNVRNLLHHLRRILPEINTFLEVDSKFFSWKPQSPIVLDTNLFRTALAEVRTAPDESARLHCLQEAASHYRGELLPGFYQDWILLQREELQQAFLLVLNQTAQLQEDMRQYEKALETTNLLIRRDLLNETAYQRAMRLHALHNDRASALQVYHVCSSVLQRELGVEPSEETRSYYEQLVLARNADKTEAEQEHTPQGRYLIGRKQEWTRLRDIWQSAQKGKPQMVVILGEAGIGKTRLANELLQWTHRQGIATACAQCYPVEGNLPFSPIVAWLRSNAVQDELESLKPLWKKELARLTPELETDDSPSASGQNWERQRLFQAIARGLLGKGTSRIFLLDDAQWADTETLEFIHYLMRFDAAARLLVVMTARLEELDDQHPLNRLHLALEHREQVAKIELGPLSQHEIGLLADDLSGEKLSEENEARIYNETEGNPFFAVEILRSGAYSTSAKIADKPLPPSLYSVLTRRLNQLSPTARDLVGMAATIGRDFDHNLISAISPTDEDTLVNALDELWARRIIQTQRGDSYHFTHGKLQDAAYENLSPARRKILHRRVAEALLSAPEVESALIAGHFEKAGQFSSALEHYLKAAQEARRVFANQNAIAHLEKVLSLLAIMQPDANKWQNSQKGVVHEELGDLYGMGSKEELAIENYKKALSLTPSQEKIQRARLTGKLAKSTGEINGLNAGKELFDQAEKELGPQPAQDAQNWQHTWLKIMFDRIWMHYDFNDIEGMQTAFEAVRPVIENTGETDKLAEYFFLYPTLIFRREGYQVGEKILEASKQALELGQKSDNLNLQVRVKFGYGFVQLLKGNFDLAIQFLTEGLRLAEQIGYVEQQAFCLTYLAAAYRRSGRVDDCQATCEQGIVLTEREGFVVFTATAHANLGWVAWKKNDLKRARLLCQKALALWNKHYPFQWFGLWVLVDISVLGLQTQTAIGYVRKLISPEQQVFAEEGDRLLRQAIQAAEKGEEAKANTLLSEAVAWAKTNYYL